MHNMLAHARPDNSTVLLVDDCNADHPQRATESIGGDTVDSAWDTGHQEGWLQTFAGDAGASYAALERNCAGHQGNCVGRYTFPAAAKKDEL